ncbi:MarR family winged helix-turn-helix transcriptional regulator [Desulfonatronum parangueonense]
MDQEIVRGFRKHLRILERLVDGWINQDCCELGITMPKCHALLALEEMEQCSLGDLAAFLDLDKSTLSRTVEALVREGLLSRNPSPGDRRMVLLSLTGKGRNTCRAINERNDALFEATLKRLGDEGEGVVVGFSKLVSAMAAEHQSRARNQACYREQGNCSK